MENLYILQRYSTYMPENFPEEPFDPYNITTMSIHLVDRDAMFALLRDLPCGQPFFGYASVDPCQTLLFHPEDLWMSNSVGDDATHIYREEVAEVSRGDFFIQWGIANRFKPACLAARFATYRLNRLVLAWYPFRASPRDKGAYDLFLGLYGIPRIEEDCLEDGFVFTSGRVFLHYSEMDSAPGLRLGIASTHNNVAVAQFLKSRLPCLEQHVDVEAG